ncbi:hypothetical protein FGADI_10288 [Fusarium gaditjirri]|uniref:Uncharacterized protein n=1 Tax=Fusarium gaditjirri TaxID=282569 RepID=A0A8H4SXY3_9HYPO|nr:hypothetical protein FGADI_10288 [Fusarium gaditjirri]
MNSDQTYPDEYSPKFVAIGIDFGTTYSGVSWARSTNPKEVNSITGWASEDHRNQREVQVPTLYDIDSGKWGFEITPDMKPMKWFKLLLLKNEDIAKEEIRNAPQLQQARDILSNSRRRLTAVQVVGYYLKNVWDHTYKALKSMLDIDNLPLRVAITIPAIWPAYAQSAMREAAKIAGITKYRDIGETTLILVQEPEAAALASLFQRHSSPEIQDVISYTVVSERPFKLEECVPGTGKLAGAFHIDQAFESYVRGKAKLKISSLKDFDYNQFILREWELGAKRSFSISNAQENYHLHPPSKAYGKLARLRHKDTLIISKYALLFIRKQQDANTSESEEMTGFFNRSLTGIRTLVGNQCREVQEETGKPPKKILLVGGLGSSEYVYDKLTEIFSNKVLRPSDGWSAVARGAVLRLLEENISSQPVHSPKDREVLRILPDVISRRSRYNYGIEVDMVAKGLDLDPEDKITVDAEGVERVSRMRWYLLKGQKIDKESRIPFFYFHHYRARDMPKKCTFAIVYSAEDKAPKRSNSSVLGLCRIECDWDKPFTEWQPVGKPSEGWRKHNDLELTMGLQGEPKWEVRVGSNKREHKFDIEYA